MKKSLQSTKMKRKIHTLVLPVKGTIHPLKREIYPSKYLILAKWTRLIFKSLKEGAIHQPWQKQQQKRRRRLKRSKRKIFEVLNYLHLLVRSIAKRNTNRKNDKSRNCQRKTMKTWLKSIKTWLKSFDQNSHLLKTDYNSQFRKTKRE